MSLPDDDCFKNLSKTQQVELYKLYKKFNKPYVQVNYDNLVKALELASIEVSMKSQFDQVLDVYKESLQVKYDVLILFLDTALPAWIEYIESTLSNNILNIIKLFLNEHHLDLSVFYLIDKKIKHAEIIMAYHDFVGTYFLKSCTGIRIYSLFYGKKCRPINFINDKADKKRNSELENELKRMRSFSDFLRSRKRMKIFQAASSSFNMFVITNDELLICLPPIESMMKGMKGIISVDYRINVFLASYLGTLTALIPTFEDFELAQKEGMFEPEMKYSEFKSLCANSFLEVEDYDEHLYLFVLNANKYFYQYFNALWRDLTNKLMFEPVSFYLTLMATIFSLLSLIQVLQNAKIIPPLY
ncbi:uncharacterized protein B0P05DRAFT_640639 [Gilbertella persicaria]|uniref:uncharacterized protein n=1 Tax=Gilbertella persicaria TaxID=101096 RepID=UPI0022205AA6|nr:uncharacterized protein B0P05DRAFT_640639 [Gilbertella persicaria]KAI8060640.1 hypothetical protein B0P05DRAFT_640639 [Gilbertella persicaria]